MTVSPLANFTLEQEMEFNRAVSARMKSHKQTRKGARIALECQVRDGKWVPSC